MTPTLEARLAEVLPCGDDRLCRPANVTMGGTPSPILHSYKCLARLRPAILALIRTLLREERERCAEHAASLFDANGYTAVVEAIRNLGGRE